MNELKLDKDRLKSDIDMLRHEKNQYVLRLTIRFIVSFVEFRKFYKFTCLFKFDLENMFWSAICVNHCVS